ncbi:hypothetical protein [Aureimonas ureilytica]|nr:hypothetical protein [Aureimonas ureilytica]
MKRPTALSPEWLFPLGLAALGLLGLALWTSQGPSLAGMMLFGFCL